LCMNRQLLENGDIFGEFLVNGKALNKKQN
jgi:hypothetical protein